METRLGKQQDIESIILLQDANLYENLSEADRKKGFVTIPFTEAQLEELIGLKGLFVAEDQGKLVGYAMAAGWDYFSQWPIFKYMSSRLKTLSYKRRSIDPERSFQYGPVCVDAAFRGKGLLPMLFEEMRLELRTRYPLGVTFINQENRFSSMAHTQRLGMTVVDEFQFSGREYYGLAFDTTRSVNR